MSNVVVTGGAGFIGSHLTEELVRRNNTVTVIDDFSTGNEKNLEGIANSSGVEIIRGSIDDIDLLNSVFRGVKTVFHCAAIASVPRSIADPESVHRINASGTLNVLIAARDAGVGKVVFSSSSAIYGDTPILPVPEDAIPDPLSPYAVTKLAAEHYCTVFQNVYGVKTVCLRYFNVFGPRQDPESQYAAVIPKFITGLLNGVAPVIFDDGEQTRDFIYVRDVIGANMLAAETDMTGIFNISNGEGVTINRLFDLVKDITGSDLRSIYREARPGDIRHSFADVSKAKSIGFKPAYDLESGLKETVAWFKNPD